MYSGVHLKACRWQKSSPITVILHDFAGCSRVSSYAHTVFHLITTPALITAPTDFLLYFHLLAPTWRSFSTSGREQIYVSTPGAY